MNDITQDQAKLITDLETYKTVTGAKRFKRTKEEISAGFTPGEALRKRLMEARGQDAPLLGSETPKQKATNSRKGDITIRIRPAAGTDTDYFENIPNESVEIILDEKWYMWFDTFVGSHGDTVNELLTDILNQGIGDIIIHGNRKVPLNGGQSDLKSEAV